MSVTRIAEKAGVSIATVSRVLNNSRPVDPSVAEKVHDAMRQLELVPSQVRRRSRSTDRQTTIAIMTLGQSYREWFELPVVAAVVAELNRCAQELHMGVLTAEMPDPTKLHPVLRRPEVRGALVFISSETKLSTKDTRVLSERMPLVRVMGGQLAPTDIDHVTPDNNSIGYLAGRYLVDQGCTQIAYLTCCPNWDFSKLRSQGLMAAAAESNLTAMTFLQNPQPIVPGFFGTEMVVEAKLEKLLDRLVAARRGRLGLFISRDAETVQVYPLLRARGLELGKDVVVVSCDNETIRLAALDPRPASIDLAPGEIAQHAVNRLARRIQHESEPPVRIMVNPRLVTGEASPF